MNLLRRRSPNISSTLGNFRNYEKKLAQPDQCAVTQLLLRAVAERADAICFGFRPEIAEDPAFLEWRIQPGEPAVPISLRVDGMLRFFASQPLNGYGMILHTMQSRSLVLGDPAAEALPLRYIYLPDPSGTKTTGKRLFAEIDFEFQLDNSFWIYIRGTRETERGVRVSDAR